MQTLSVFSQRRTVRFRDRRCNAKSVEETSRHRNTAGMKSLATHIATQTLSRQVSRLSEPARTAIIIAV